MSIDPGKLNHGRARYTAGTDTPAATVLLVEDEVSVRTLLVRFLSMHGFEVLVAENGAGALLLWAAHKNEIALLLTDVVMPGGLSGRELADQFQSEHPALKVLFTSGYSMELLNSHAAIGHSIHFVQKPYRPEQLLAAIRIALAGDTTPILVLEKLC
ncbi:MAG TPA: response regulator [Candidatus Limnocylindria bacterium]|nr:response regulator [Candidatus Limnocylindria bacterium]